MDASRLVIELPPGEARAGLQAYARRRGFSAFLGEKGRAPRKVLGVASPGDLPPVVEALRRFPLVLVEFTGDRVIPLENLIAMRQGKGPSGRPAGTLWVRARSPSEVPGLLGALEHGSDGVVLRVKDASEIDHLEAHLEHPALSLSWRTARVLRVAPGGLGERVAVDTTSLLLPEEGLLVGSQGAFLLHVVSEAQGSKFTRARPFRVNAGAVHSYTLMADGSTRYLSELEPGDRVVVATPRGPARSVRVGRLKIERRPMTLVEVLQGRSRYTLFAQEAETVRLSTPSGARSVPDLRAGETVYGVALPPARHFGMAVQEMIVER